MEKKHTEIKNNLRKVCGYSNFNEQLRDILLLMQKEARSNIEMYVFCNKNEGLENLCDYLDKPNRGKYYLYEFIQNRVGKNKTDSFYEAMIKCLGNIQYEPKVNSKAKTDEVDIKKEYDELLTLAKKNESELKSLLNIINKKQQVCLWEVLIEVESTDQDCKREFYPIASNYLKKTRADLYEGDLPKGLTSFTVNNSKVLPIWVTSQKKGVLLKDAGTDIVDSWNNIKINSTYWYVPNSSSNTKTMIMLPLIYKMKIADNLEMKTSFGVVSFEFNTHFLANENNELKEIFKQIAQIITDAILNN